jgi:hypothetical protein
MPTAKYEFVKNKKLCMHCLASGHFLRDCTYFKDRKCGIDGCERLHHRLLHAPKTIAVIAIEDYFEIEAEWEREPEEVHSINVAQHDDHPGRQSKYVSILTTTGEISAPKSSKRKRIVVALDSCANSTNIDEDLANELKLTRIKTGIVRNIESFNGNVTETTDLVQVFLWPEGADTPISLLAFTKKNLLKNSPLIDWEKEAEEFPYLKKAKVPRLEPTDKMGLLIGTDEITLMASDKYVMRNRYEPAAFHTQLGWAFGGKARVANQVEKDVVGITTMTIANHQMYLTFDNFCETENGVDIVL